MTLLVTICSQCGDPFDSTEYPLCNDCRYDHRFIKLRKQHEVSTEDKSKQDEEGQQGNEGI
jgi:NMD protein affecting ribosome stability and mRNA decay